MVFVNKKLVKKQCFNAHAETILALRKLVKRQLYFLSLSLAFTVQLCAISTESATRDDSAESGAGTVTDASRAVSTVARDSLERIRIDVSIAMAGALFEAKSHGSAAEAVSAPRETRLRRSFDTHKSKACLDLVAFAATHDVTSASEPKRGRAGLPPKYPKHPQRIAGGAAGSCSPTRHRARVAIRVGV